jgi:thiol-disulfide isomerase/thioredoxin
MKRVSLVFFLLLLPLLALAGDSKTPAEFSLPDADGKTVALSSFRGQVVLLDFWATYCKPCKAELPILDRLQTKYEKKGLRVLGVAVDPESKTAKEHLAKNPVRFQTLYDPDDVVRERFGGNEMPALYLLDKKGVVRSVHKGALAEDDAAFLKELEALLAEK